MNIGITIGDAAGIGPEVILKALQTPLPPGFRPVVFGSVDVLEREDERLSKQVPGYQRLAKRFLPLLALDAVEPDVITIMEACPDIDWRDVPTGQQDPRCATLQLEAFIQAINAIQTQKIHAIVTGPWNKDLLQTIDKPVVGHTEILADRFRAPECVMMLGGPRLRVALLTTHVPLRAVPDLISDARLESTIRTTIKDLGRLFGIHSPRIAVCGLNPHAGEQGAMGDEEVEILVPALRKLRRELSADVELVGPLPSDTLFASFGKGGAPYDVVICMYHDQGLIPLKLLHFGESANITLGLPIVRTSVDHGTAYDIAGQGIADAGSMRYAIELAVDMARRIHH